MPTPAPQTAISDIQRAAILDRMGHESCPGVEITFDVELRPASAAAPRQHATIYRPAQAGADPAPAVLAFHGGGFNVGDPNGCGAIAKTLALSLGIVTVSVSYRLGTAEKPTTPAILEDAVHAWRWLHAHAAKLGIDPARVAVHGESAGCLLAGHLAVGSPHVAAAAGLPAPKALYAFWGPLDFVARWYDNGEANGAEINIFGPGGYPAHVAGYHQLSVLTHAAGKRLPPALFIYGRTDTVVHARQAQLALSCWERTGSHAEALILANIGHGVIGDNREVRWRALEKSAVFGAWRHAAT